MGLFNDIIADSRRPVSASVATGEPRISHRVLSMSQTTGEPRVQRSAVEAPVPSQTMPANMAGENAAVSNTAGSVAAELVQTTSQPIKAALSEAPHAGLNSSTQTRQGLAVTQMSSSQEPLVKSSQPTTATRQDFVAPPTFTKEQRNSGLPHEFGANANTFPPSVVEPLEAASAQRAQRRDAGATVTGQTVAAEVSKGESTLRPVAQSMTTLPNTTTQNATPGAEQTGANEPAAKPARVANSGLTPPRQDNRALRASATLEPPLPSPRAKTMRSEAARAPQVRIGQVNVIVEAPAAPPVQSKPNTADDLSSRLFLRGL